MPFQRTQARLCIGISHVQHSVIPVFWHFDHDRVGDPFLRRHFHYFIVCRAIGDNLFFVLRKGGPAVLRGGSKGINSGLRTHCGTSVLLPYQAMRGEVRDCSLAVNNPPVNTIFDFHYSILYA